MKTKIAIYETDVQEDFSLRTGALFVHGNKPWKNTPYGAEEKLPKIFAIHSFAYINGWKILGSVDRHFYEDAELIRNTGGVFDDHCMNGTSGQLRLKYLHPQEDIYIRSKDGPLMDIRIYSDSEIQKYIDSSMQLIFEKQSYDVDTNPNYSRTMKLLFEQGLEKLIINGFATDYCVLAKVLAAAKYRTLYNPDAKLYVVTDAIEEVNIDFSGNIDPDFGKKALEKMVSAGAILTTTRDVILGRFC